MTSNMARPWRPLAFAVLGVLYSISLLPGAIGAQESDEIVVRAPRRGHDSVWSDGRRVRVRPRDASQFESSTHLRQESTVLPVETGRVSAGGFVVPRIRGQDAKVTDIYLDDVHLQDPYAGLPRWQDLDLRAVGSLDLEMGASSARAWGFPSLGVLRYRWVPQADAAGAVGMSVGSPQGSMAWVRGDWPSAEDASGAFRIYARSHETSGRYDYYSDEGTPYNRADDRIRERTNNDLSGEQFMTAVALRRGAYRLRGLGWVNRSRGGVPGRGVVEDVTARESSSAHILHSAVSRDFGVGKVDLLAGSVEDVNQYQDASGTLVPGVTRSALGVKSAKAGARLVVGDLERVGLEGSVEYEHVRTHARLSWSERAADETRRLADLGGVAVAARLPFGATCSMKVSERVHSDFREGDDPSSHSGRARGVVAHVSQEWHDSVAAYAQVARLDRLPSLVEEFGNGTTLSPSAGLSAERVDHVELGMGLGFGRRETGLATTLGLALFQDQTRQKIVWVPVSVASMKAINLARTQIRGLEGSWEVSVGENKRARLGASYLDASDVTGQIVRGLPGIPDLTWVGEGEWNLTESWTLRALSRFRSEIYRDLNETLVSPSQWLHDLSADYRMGLGRVDLGLGLNVRNVLNTMSQDLDARDSRDGKGATALSDLSGYPLPGRQWVLTFEAAF